MQALKKLKALDGSISPRKFYFFIMTDPSQKIIIDKADEGLRLDVFLCRKALTKSRTQAVRAVSTGRALLNGKSAKASRLLKAKDILEFSPEEQKSFQLKSFPLSLEIVYEDEDIIVINKPALLPVHPGPGHEADTLVNALISTRKLAPGAQPLRPGVAHRLDKDTSGLLVMAKSPLALRELIRQFKKRAVKREYLALALKPPSPPHGLIKSWIARHPIHRTKLISSPLAQPGAKKAISFYRLLQTHESGLSLLHCRLKTGRTHQIRVHLSSLGSALAGDKLYGPKKLSFIRDTSLKAQIHKLRRTALHARRLAFRHPRRQNLLDFQAPWPKDMQSLLKKIGF